MHVVQVHIGIMQQSARTRARTRSSENTTMLHGMKTFACSKSWSVLYPPPGCSRGTDRELGPLGSAPVVRSAALTFVLKKVN